MAEKPVTPEVAPDAPAAPPVPPKRSPGHRGAEVKDTVAEMAAKAHEISLEAGSKMAAAMKDVINAAAGLTGFVLESARDLVQYMVRRGQMTQEEADKLIKAAEEAQVGRPAPKPAASKPEKAVAVPEEDITERSTGKSTGKSAVAPAAAPKKGAAKVESESDEGDDAEDEDDGEADEKPAAKAKAKSADKPVAKKATAKKK
jgi:hypothetical protein